jgi:succinoglycan biosynthesis transport protein ExoP
VPDLQELIADLWRRRLLILMVALIVLAMAVPLILLREPVWRAEAKVAIDALQPQVTGANTTMSRFEDGALETEIQIMRSRELVEQVIEQLGLDRLPDFNPLLQPPSPLQAFKAWLLGLVKPWLPAGDPVDDMVAISPLTPAIEQFLQNLETVPIGHSQVIAVSLRSTNRARVADAVNALAAAYLSVQTMARRELMARVGADLEAHTEGLAERVRASEQALEEFRAESGLIRGPDISLRTQGMVNLTTLLAEATAERVTAESKIAQLRRGGGAAYAVPEALNAPHIGRML